MLYKIFFIFFIISSSMQLYWFMNFDIYDSKIWPIQAQYVENNDNRQYDPTYVYNPPGGPIILGNILFKNIFNLSYTDSFFIFLSILNGLIISSICIICYILFNKDYYHYILLGTLSFNRLYLETTPPSASVSLLIILLFFLTIYLYKSDFGNKKIIIWSIVSGTALAIRPEIASLFIFFFLIFLYKRLNIRYLIMIIITSTITFIILDPFMWRIPFQHIIDIFSKVFSFHQNNFVPYISSYLPLLNISSIEIISIFIIVIAITVFKIDELIPKRLIVILLIITAILYLIILTSHQQPLRYFIPIIFIWESILPLYLNYLILNILTSSPILRIEFKYIRYLTWAIISIIFFSYQLMIFYLIY